ncbi:hypothetical protein [Candidatus Nitrosotenuis aquarius]|uniref:hypothetical protein n=1 Tax=Candidatus Nitrosotenuis aquarius TaxID=1846278 RepID=UPI0013C2A931|nr:hypothetical protein [Candidatus Nitrosotenuis aquarius]
MKPFELKKLVQEYQLLRTKQAKSYDHRIQLRLEQLKHRYYHETGNDLDTK